MNILLKTTLFGAFFIFLSCNSQSCKDLPEQFNSYNHANKEIKSTNFKIEESLDTSRSSFIEGASYYSCDGNTGFLLIEIRNTEYIYQNVPLSVWKNFKSAESLGRFYGRNIKGSYRMVINN